MIRKADAEAALETVPGWAGARVAPLKGGETNAAWLVEREGERAVLKFDRTVRGAPFGPRTSEAAIQAKAAEQGLASRVIHAADSILVTEYAEGRAWADADVDDPSTLDMLAAALRRVHSLPLSGRSFDAIGAATRYFEALVDADPVIAESCLATVRAAPRPANLCCCHNDLVPANILIADGIQFIDWEFACDNDPFFDLATIVVELELSTTSTARLLDAYFDGDGARWHRQLARQERLYEALAWLWRESRGRI